MPIFGPASPDAQVAPILQAHVADIKNQIPSELQSVAPKASPTNLFNDYLNTGNQMFKDASSQALNKLQEFASDANTAAKKFTAAGIPGLFSSNTPATYADALQQGVQNRVANVEKATSNPAMFAAGSVGGENEIGNAVKDVASQWLDHTSLQDKVWDSDGTDFDVYTNPQTQDFVHGSDSSKGFNSFKKGQPVFLGTNSDNLGNYDNSAIVSVKPGLKIKVFNNDTPEDIQSEIRSGSGKIFNDLKSQGYDGIYTGGDAIIFDPKNTEIKQWQGDNSAETYPKAPQGKISTPAAMLTGAAGAIAAAPSILDKLGSTSFTNPNSADKQTLSPIPNAIFNATRNTKYATPQNLKSILQAENAPQDPHAINTHTVDGSTDYGLFQINSKNIPHIQKLFAAQGQHFNPFNEDDSAKAASIVFDENVAQATRLLKRPLTPSEMLDAYHSPGEVVAAAHKNEAAQKKQDTYVTRSKSS